MLQLPPKPVPLPLPPFMTMQVSPAPIVATSTIMSLNPSERRIYEMLRRYITAIRRDDFLPRLNDVLQARFSSSSSLGNGAAPVDIQGYYTDHPELRSYTLGVELDRDLDYTLILRNGTSVTDKNAIRSYFDNNSKGSESTSGPIDTQELLIRAANQSLLADALAALTGSEDVLKPPVGNNKPVERKPGLILCGPVLSMTSVVEKCHFTVDLQGKKVEAICVLAISVPDENRRLVLARAILIANFRPGRKRGPIMQYTMKLVKAHHFPGSRTIRDAAVSLAKDQEKNIVFQNDDLEESKEVAEEYVRPQRRQFFFSR